MKVAGPHHPFAAERVLAVKHFGGRMSLMQALLNHHLWDQDAPKTN